MLIVFAAVFWLLWYFYDNEVRDIIRWIRYGEMWMISWFAGQDFHVSYRGQSIPWWRGYVDTARWAPGELSYDHLAYFNALAMKPLQPVFMGLLAAAAGRCLFYGPNTQYRTKLDLEGLIRRQAQNFKVIAPFVEFNPGKQPWRAPGDPVPVKLPSFAEALSPEEWLAYHRIPVANGKINEPAAIRALQRQLGPRWKGYKALEPYQQILLAAFCLKAARKRNESDDMIARIAACWSFQGGLRLGRDGRLLRDARAVLRNKDIAGKTLAEMNRHAFVTTALLRALAFAREEGGVLAPATFVWLRGHDRTLWYPLNNLGRKSFHAEAMGAMAHYKAERMTQRPIPVPKMEDAVKTLGEYMTTTRARPIPPLDEGKKKKRGGKKTA